MTRVIKAVTIWLLTLCVQMAHSQKLHQTAAQWELRGSNNDPTIASREYKKLRIKLNSTTFLSFTGSVGDPYPATLLLERTSKPSGFYFLPLHVQVLKGGNWDKYTINLQVTSWGEVQTKEEEYLHRVYRDFFTGSKVRIRVGIKGENWYEIPLQSFQTQAKSVFTAGYNKPPTLVLLQPSNRNNGGESQSTLKPSTTKPSAATVKSTASGSKASTPISPTSHPIKNPHYTQAQTRHSLEKSFPLRTGFGNEGAAQANMVRKIQKAVYYNPTGILDRETIAKVASFITDKKNLRLIDRPLDPEDIIWLTHPTYPGITLNIYEIVMDLVDKMGEKAKL